MLCGASLRMLRLHPHDPAVFALLALEFERRVKDVVGPEPLLDRLFDPLGLAGVRLAGIDMGIEDIDIRTEAPEMDMVDPVDPGH
jgi:hypothetical protein